APLILSRTAYAITKNSLFGTILACRYSRYIFLSMSGEGSMAGDDGKVGAKEKITILLAEYNTLRAEILQRNTVLNQFLIFTSATAIGLIGGLFATDKYLYSLLSFIVLSVLIITVYRAVIANTFVLAEQVRRLEHDINKL